MTGLYVLCCVVNMGVTSKIIKSAQKHGIKRATITLGRGTVASRMLEILGINEVRKEVITMIAEANLAAKAIKGISEDMAFHKPHHGIAFSLRVGELICGMDTANKSISSNEVKNSMYKIIYVIVDKGKAEEVIEVANKAGARGGTIINARSAGIQEIHKLFSVEIEPQKEKVFIITKSERKDNIVDAIRTHLKLDKPGNGIMVVLDINEAYGLH